ncbi:hypothetical protein [Bradyrhizobium sp. LVM 105]|uniref:hypothetical protein n=1 Tax=Bradyrhizobium sp. LVM 105 TaxID=2341115 RepID=UPI000F807012|nr:hypothetical protein [Bradyrhizobium sp. LVM 105]RTE93837.1 hypothetical protein D6B98_07580 [Bradyrhizobium sp. LVM 105]
MQLAAKLANDLSQLGSVLLDHAPCFLQPGELGFLTGFGLAGVVMADGSAARGMTVEPNQRFRELRKPRNAPLFR